MPEFGEIASQPDPVAELLAAHGAGSAVVLPVEPSDFPLELPALLKVQVALHEGFHVGVQAPRWMGHTSDWPEWEAQPDRAGVRSCYTHHEKVESLFEDERADLLGVVSALLDGDRSLACSAGAEFLSAYDARIAAVSEVRVTMADGDPGSCQDAEAMMELEEGVADFVSWVHLYQTGLATRAQLERRYQARQGDVFYLTGAMKMHATSLLRGDPLAVSREIIDSRSVAEGSLQAKLEGALTEACASRW
jgi:hypothetical protein